MTFQNSSASLRRLPRSKQALPLPPHSPAAATGGRLSDSQDNPYWRRNSRTLALGNLIVNLGWSTAFAFLPLVVRDMGVGADLERWVGAIVFFYFAMSCVSTPVWGVLADHYGRKSMVLRAGLGMGVGFILLSMITSPLPFLLLMMVIGLANGYVPAGMALIATTTPRARMGGALSLAQVGAWLGTMMGPLTGAALVGVLPQYRHLFTVTGIVMLAAGLLALFLVREQHVRPLHPLRIDLRADIRRLRKVPTLGVLYYMSFLFAATVFGSTTVVSLFTLKMLEIQPNFRGLSVETWIAITALGLTVASVIVLPIWGALLNRYEPVRLLRIQLLGSFVTSLAIPLVRDPLELTLTRLLFGLFIAGLPPTLIRMVKERAPKGMEARAFSYGTALQNVGSGGAALVAGLMAPYLGLRAYFWLASGMLLVGLLMWRRLERH